MTVATPAEVSVSENGLVSEFEYINDGLCVDEMSCTEIQYEMLELCFNEDGSKTDEDKVMVLYQYLVAIGVETRKILIEVRTRNLYTKRFGLRPRAVQLEMIRSDGIIPERLIKANVMGMTKTSAPAKVNADVQPAAKEPAKPTLMPLFRPPVLVS